MPANDDGDDGRLTRQVVELLRHASGTSEFVICAFLDIRDFTPFSKLVESPDVAIFIKRVFCRILDSYFREASYFKLLGDGLLLVVPYTEENLAEVASRVVQACFKLIEDFPGFCSGDPMVHYPVPQRLGIGIARGTACRIESGGQVLDYCGRVVNLAARLMNLAHPSGIVIAGDFALSSLLPTDLAARFKPGLARLKGITADDRPVTVYYAEGLVREPADDRGERSTDEADAEALLLHQPDVVEWEPVKGRRSRPSLHSLLRGR